MSDRRDIAVWLLAAYLAVGAAAALASGAWNAWGLGIDGDMQGRVAEYDLFRVGTYPNGWLDRTPDGGRPKYSVYPPYALPMFAAFFEPGGLMQGRSLVQLLSAVALVLIGIFGRSTLGGHGLPWGVVGALAAAAITVNRSVISLGQFSLMCMGFIMLQIGLLERGRPYAAGVCWAAAMIKPQIGLAFGALFLFNRQWRGLLIGGAILATLSLLALWWTEVSPAALLHHWLFKMQMRFAITSSGFGPATVAEWMGWNHRVVQYSMLAALAAATPAIVRIVARDIWLPDLLPLAAICAVMGRVFFYHGVYDQVMLFPLLLACLSTALKMPRWRSITVAVAVAATLWIPQRIQEFVPGHEFLQPVVWLLAAIHMGVAATRSPVEPRVDPA